jgi:hypothetical protein
MWLVVQESTGQVPFALTSLAQQRFEERLERGGGGSDWASDTGGRSDVQSVPHDREPDPPAQPTHLMATRTRTPVSARGGGKMRRGGAGANWPQSSQGSQAYFNFFLMRSWLVCPHFFLRQLLARGGRRA